MLKIDVLLHHSDQMAVLEDLKQLGVVHIELGKATPTELIGTIEREINLLKKTLEIIEELKLKSGDSYPEKSPDHMVDTCQNILDTHDKLKTLQKQQSKNRSDIALASFWGLNNTAKLTALKDRLRIIPYQIKNRLFDQYDFSNVPYTIVERNTQETAFLVVDDGNNELPFDAVELPESGVEALKIKKNELDASLQEIRSQLMPAIAFEKSFKQTLDDKANQLQNLTTVNNSQSFKEGEIVWLQGWTPKSMMSRLARYLDDFGCTWSSRKPETGEDIPVKLVNTKYSRIFEPITQIFQLPHYYELDLTPFIAVFYPIFFAYCLGDAGYGIVLLGLSIYSYQHWFKDSRNLATLGVILGVLTTFMGIVKSGSIFGMPILDQQHPFLQFFEPFVLIPDDQSFVFNAFNVAIMIGVVQVFCGILIAIVKSYKQDGPAAALSPFGKLIIIVSALLGFLYHMQSVEALAGISGYVPWMILVGIILFIFFNPFHEGIGQKIGHGLLPTFFIFTNMLGDILSYVRLFALGVASSVLGLVVNQIGMQIMGGGFFSLLLAIVFLIFGHSLNMALATLGAFVHPLRLTFVEFYNNAHFEGGGRPYQPLTKNDIA